MSYYVFIAPRFPFLLCAHFAPLHQLLISKPSFWLPGLLAGLALLLEEERRRAELAMYVLPKAVMNRAFHRLFIRFTHAPQNPDFPIQSGLLTQDNGRGSATRQPSGNGLWPVALVAIAGLPAVWFARETRRNLPRQRGRHERPYDEHWFIRTTRDSVRAFGFWLAHLARPRARPAYPTRARARRNPRRNNLRQGHERIVITRPDQDDCADMPPLEDIPVRSFLDDLFIVDPFTRMTHLVPDYVDRIRARRDPETMNTPQVRTDAGAMYGEPA
ncbi:hypothetical protein B0H16DRAFT_1741853 [Mycena metata]|uniref:Uncharacterized protein n=1 Tax=Mycena metata TaxID=1033252 RepID=A0AAD7MFW7_9AGAR|nr:hypothetical protein B0H16DRAFT_1741853 [Mycena metata]